jgi:hypothetical protein
VQSPDGRITDSDKINLLKKVPNSDNLLVVGANRDNGFFTVTHYEIVPKSGNEVKSLLGRGDLLSADGDALNPSNFLGAPPTRGSSEGLSGSEDRTSLANGPSEVKPLTPVESTGEKARSTLASKVDTNAVERKLTEGLGQTPEYNKVNMKEQAEFATDLLAKDPDSAMRIAMGQEAPPAHILPEAVFTAVENKAVNEGDIDTLRRLATESNMSTQATAMGQRIRALGERDDESPVKKIQEVKDARAKNGGAKKVKAEVDTIKDEIKKSAPSKQNWSDFIKDIQCGY